METIPYPELDGDMLEDVQMDEGYSLAISNASTETPPLGIFLGLPGELRQKIYEEYLKGYPKVDELIYEHPDVTAPTLFPVKGIPKVTSLVQQAGSVAVVAHPATYEDQTANRLSKIVHNVVKTHHFLLLQNRQIYSEYAGVARRHIIHSLSLDIRNVPFLQSWSSIPLSELARLKLTIRFGSSASNVEHDIVRDHIVHFVASLPNLVDLQIVFTHAYMRQTAAGLWVGTDWQLIRWELFHYLMPLLREATTKKKAVIRIFPFVTMAWGRSEEFP